MDALQYFHRSRLRHIIGVGSPVKSAFFGEFMARGRVKHPWEEEVEIWDLLSIKGEALYRLPAHTNFTEYRLNKSKKRFENLSYSEWTDLPENLQKVHPKSLEYTEERRKEAVSDRHQSTNDPVATYIEHLKSRVMFGDFYRPMRSSSLTYGTWQEVVIDAIGRQEPELAPLQEAFKKEFANRQQRFEEICNLLNNYVQV
jgi:hypothetical protein